MSQVVLFDLGNTLVRYYALAEFPPILKAAITGASDTMPARFRPEKEDADLWTRVEAENYESRDGCVRPLEDRLRRIFQAPEREWTDDLAMTACRGFMQSIFALGSIYDDVLPTLADLRKKGYRTAIVSNTPWGSPASLWREEIARLGLAGAVDHAIFCCDCGWRKPARQIFEHTLRLMNARPEESVFVGDDPRWDIEGPKAAGIDSLLIDRAGREGDALRSLVDLPAHLKNQQ